MYVFTCKYVYICIYVFMYIYIYVCMYTYRMNIYICIYVYIYICSCAKSDLTDWPAFEARMGSDNTQVPRHYGD